MAKYKKFFGGYAVRVSYVLRIYLAKDDKGKISECQTIKYPTVREAKEAISRL
jgi:hypothetical protein